MRLYHFTCSHGAEQIRAAGELRPHPQVQLGDMPLLWLTDLDEPTRYQIGLTSETLRCDRMEHRFVVDCEALRWSDYVRTLPRELRHEARWLALAPGAMPMHWYVSFHPVPLCNRCNQGLIAQEMTRNGCRFERCPQCNPTEEI